MHNSIRPVVRADLPLLKGVIDSSELFPGEMLDDMIQGYLNQSAVSQIWLTFEVEGRPVAIAYCAPEPMTEGSYNLYLIAVHKSQQGKGIGGQLMRFVENQLHGQGAHLLLVETSGLPEFELTRKFYLQLGYHSEAVIRDFYKLGEDKVVFWKRLD